MTNDWIGFGIQSNITKGMVGADLFTIDTSKWKLTDQHSDAQNGLPLSDASQNYGLWKADLASNYFISITRSLDTSDSKDLVLEEKSTYYALWAYGKMQSGVQQHHSDNRGSVSFVLTENGGNKANSIVIGLGIITLMMIS